MTDPTTPPVEPTPPQPMSAAPVGAAPAKTPVLSIISLIAGIVGILGAWIVVIPIVGSILGLPIPAAAVVLGFLGRKKEPASKGLWLTGIILGFVALVLAVVMLIVWIAAIGVGVTNPGGY
jgi:hypothetical protein